MSELLKLFVSNHAIIQFQQRIASVDEDKTRRFITAGILQATNRKLIPANAEHPETWRIRTKHPFPFEFRALCVFDAERDCHVVKTIVRGDSCVTRQHKRRHGGRREQLS